MSIFTPARIAFTDADDLKWTVIDTIVDLLFAVDLILNFFFAYYDEEYTLVDDRRTIAKTYLRSWFAVDLLSIAPVSLVFRIGDFNSLFRIARASRLYRIVKLVRLVRMLKIAKERHKLVKYLHEVLKISESFERLFFFFLIFLVVCHVTCCFWIATARFSEFGPDTWVSRYGLNDLSQAELYVASFYFTITTITTVGFGDISGGTTVERIICVLIMLFGVIAFSFSTGTLSNIIADYNSSKAKLKEKMAILADLKTDYNIGQRLFDELSAALKFDHTRNIGSTVNFVNELPYRLRIELAAKIH